MANKVCIDLDTKQFRDLLQASGLPSIVVESYCYKYVNNYGRFPHLDEIPGANSEPYLREQLKISKSGVTKVKNLLDHTGQTDIQKALLQLNNYFRDVEIEGTIIGEDIILNIKRKPQMQSETFQPQDEVNNRHSAVMLDTICDKLQSFYGVNVVSVTNAEISQDPQLSQIPDAPAAKAFIFNNTIYINTDNATTDSKLHELLHLLFSTMRDVNPELYFNIISKAQQFKNFEFIASNYPNRTMGDLLEEVYVTELSKFLSGMESSIQQLSQAELYEIYYQITRILDTALEGEISTKCIPEAELFMSTFEKVGQLVNSPLTSYRFLGSLDETKVHRMLANTKSQLLKEKRLEEVCE